LWRGPGAAMRFVIGVDVGTTGARALIVDQAGNVRGQGVGPYAFETPRPGWAEQDPDAWWRGTGVAIRAALGAAGASKRDVVAIGLSGQMHSLTLLDQNGGALRAAILWNDQRAAAECEEITRRVGRERLIALTRNPALPGFTAPKLLWTRNHEPHAYARIASVLLPKDYVRYRLTDVHATDVSDASGTGLFDVTARAWSAEVLAALDIPTEWMPRATESPVLGAAVSEVGAAETGLASGTPVAAGGGDQAAQAIGTGVVRPGPLCVTIGTSGVVFATLDAPVVDPGLRTHTFCHAVPGRWHMMGVMLSAGGALRWLRQAFASGVDYGALDAEAEITPPGAEGLVFLPYLTGERTPYPDPNARGAFVGLSLVHGRGHLVRAVMEGVAFGLRDSFEIIRAVGVEITQVRATGGGAASRLWNQILADVLGVEVVVMNITEGAAYGAALLASVGAGLFSTIEAACEAGLCVASRAEPRPNVGARYDALYETYRALYPALRPSFARLAGAPISGT